MAHVIALANQKGGVSKTTSAANLAVALAEADSIRVLAVDLDPQANLTRLFGISGDEDEIIFLDDLLGSSTGARAPVVKTNPRTGERLPGGVHLIPCTPELAQVPATMMAHPAADAPLRLRALLTTLDGGYDFVILDTPPGVNVLSSLALMAATDIIIPARPSDLDFEGAGNLYDMVESGAYGEGLEIMGILLTQQDKRWLLGRDMMSASAASDMRMIPVAIPFAVKVGKAMRYGQPTIATEPDGRVGSAYRELGRWVREQTDGRVSA